MEFIQPNQKGGQCVKMSMVKSAGGSILYTAAFANAAVAGTQVQASIQWNLALSATKEVIIPTAETWILTDLFAASAADAGTDINPIVEFYKDADRKLDNSKFLNTVLVANTSRPNGLNANLEYEGGSHMTAIVISSVVAGAARNVKAVAPYEKY